MAETTEANFGPDNYPDLAEGGYYYGAQIGQDLGPWGAPGTIVGEPFVDDRGYVYDWKMGQWMEPAPEVEQPLTTELKPVDLSQPFIPELRQPMAAPTGVRFNIEQPFGPVTPSGYAQPPIDPMSYYSSINEGPSTMAGGGGGFENTGGFRNPSTPGVSVTSPSSGQTTTPSTNIGQIYNPGEYNPSTGIGVVYSPGPDEQVATQPTTKPTGSPWGSAVIPGGGLGPNGRPLGPDNPLRPDRPGSDPYTGRFIDNDGNEWDYDRGEWIYAKIPETPLVGPRFETEPVNVTIPVEQQPQTTTTPATTKQEETKQETKPATTTYSVRQTKVEVPQRNPIVLPEPYITSSSYGNYAPFNFNKLIGQETIKPNLIDLPSITNRNVDARRPIPWNQMVNYDPEEILAAAMRSMGGRMARRSMLNELR